MDRNTQLRAARVVAAAAFAIGMSSIAVARGGGGGGFSGGDSGDSSMNPFTGDSWAYFHGGHNLGEAGTIRPNRMPAAPVTEQDGKVTRTTPAPGERNADVKPREPERNASSERSVNR